jgi:hypothetical protein
MRTYPLSHIPRGIRYETRAQMIARHERRTRPIRIALRVVAGLLAMGAGAAVMAWILG